MIMALNAFLVVLCLTTTATVLGCGTIQPGQERTLSFTLSGFKLPAAMVYSDENGVSSKAPTISLTEQRAKTFVQNLIKRSVEDVLYQQGRGAGLSDDVISSILQQVNVDVNYTPLKCAKVFNMPGAGNGIQNMLSCHIVNDIVVNTCTPTANNDCQLANLESVPSKYTTITGNLKITNIIMANWSNGMWLNVLNRVVRSLTSGPLASNFYGATITLN